MQLVDVSFGGEESESELASRVWRLLGGNKQQEFIQVTTVYF